VIYDCVQFPRRGWVHRNRLIDQSGTLRWLTLPLQKAPREVCIRDLRFASDAPALFEERLRPFCFASGERDLRDIMSSLRNLEGSPVDYIERLLQEIMRYLGLPWNVIRSSALNVPLCYRGQSRILEIARTLGAKRYVNAPGGRDLYDPGTFRDAGIELCFLSDYGGPATSILSRLMIENRNDIAEELVKCSFQCP